MDSNSNLFSSPKNGKRDGARKEDVAMPLATPNLTLSVAIEIPSDGKFNDHASKIEAQCLRKLINVQHINRGLSSRGIRAAVVHVSNERHLTILKKVFPSWKDAKSDKTDQDHSVVVLNQSQNLPNKNYFIAALSDFGQVKVVKVIKPVNLLATFESKDAAAACIQAGGIMVQGRRYQVRPLIPKGTEVPKRVDHSAWLHGLPAYVTDLNLADFMGDINATHWRVTKKRLNGHTKTWAKVIFNSEECLNTALEGYSALGNKPLKWSKTALCVSCGQSGHISKDCTLAKAMVPTPRIFAPAPARPKSITPLQSGLAYNLVASASAPKPPTLAPTAPKAEASADLGQIFAYFQRALKAQEDRFMDLLAKQGERFIDALNMTGGCHCSGSPAKEAPTQESSVTISSKKRKAYATKPVFFERPVLRGEIFNFSSSFQTEMALPFRTDATLASDLNAIAEESGSCTEIPPTSGC
jgi:Zinc knuckle